MMKIAALTAMAIRQPRRATRAILYKLMAPLGHRNFIPFIVLGRDRTGSNLLLDYLNSNRNIRVDSEIFSRLDGRSVEQILSNAFSRQPFWIKAKGFKIFYYQPMDDPSGHVWTCLGAMDSLRVIHLKRRNVLQAEVSSKIAYITSVWRTRAGDSRQIDLTKHLPFDFPADQLRKRFIQTRKWEEDADLWFHRHRVFTVYYEEIISDPENTMRQISDFLGVRYSKPQSNLKKQGNQPLSAVVSNWEQLREVFDGTEWQVYFDEAD